MSIPIDQKIYGRCLGVTGYIELRNMLSAQEDDNLGEYSIMVPPFNDPNLFGTFESIPSIHSVGNKLCVRVTLADRSVAVLSADSGIVTLDEPRCHSGVINTVVPVIVNPTMAKTVVGKTTNRIQSMDSRIISSVDIIGYYPCYDIVAPWYVINGDILVLGGV